MIITLLLCVMLIIMSYYMCVRKYNYWKLKGVKYEEGLLFFGSIGNVYAKKLCFSEYVTELYQKYPKDKFVGFFISHGRNALILRDPELIKNVLVTDFQYFQSRALNSNKTVMEPMLKNPFFADDGMWKLLRQKMTPAFTVDRIKAMLPLIIERTVCLQRTVISLAERRVEVDVQKLMECYTTDVIGVCGFGIDSDTLKDPSSQYIQLSKRMISSTERDALVAFMKWTSPEINKSMYNLPPTVEKDVVTIVKNIMHERNYKPSGRKDFIDMLLELKMEGSIKEESLKVRNADDKPQVLEMDEVLMAAQVFMFFAAGFETTSLATSYTLHQLALHPDKQAKCHKEIDEVLSRHQGKLTYEGVEEMKYLQMCLKESFRMLPPMGFLSRQCVRPYTFPGTNLSIDPGVHVIVSVQGVHNDQQYFVAPDQFEPERFGEGCRIPNHVYLPFGDGPRACIAQQLGQMQSLAGLVAILSLCSLAPGANTRKPIIDPSSFIIQKVQGGLPLILTLRQKNDSESSQINGSVESDQLKEGKKMPSIKNRISHVLFKKKIKLEKLPAT